MNKKYYHYTDLNKLKSIIEAGMIYPSPEYTDTPVIKAGRVLSIKEATYLSTHPIIEMGCIKITREQMAYGVTGYPTVQNFADKHGIARIIIPSSVKVLTWNKMRKAQGVPSRDNDELIAAAISMGSEPLKHWYGVVGAIHLDEVIYETYDNGSWI